MNVRLRGQSGLSNAPLRMSANSQKRTFVGVLEVQNQAIGSLEGMQFLWRGKGGTISLNLGVIWEMSG